MAQFVYTMHRVGKVVPPKRHILKNISLSFFPGAKIGVLGLNGAGKSTLLRIMAGIDTEIEGEARPQPGIKIGYLPQEPQLNPEHTVRESVEEAVAEVKQGEIQSVVAVGRAKQVSVVALASRRHVAHHRFVLDAVQPDERQSQRVDHGGRLHHFATVAFARPAHLSLRQIARIVAERRRHRVVEAVRIVKGHAVRRLRANTKPCGQQTETRHTSHYDP